MSTETGKQAKRPYRKKARAAQEEETRHRITQAAMELHGTVGPARTTIKAVAERAGVQRATVYRHFPDEESLFAACSAHWFSLNPAPDPDDYARISDPSERLAAGLRALYEWYEWAEPMLENTLRDAPLVPAMRPAYDAFGAYLDAFAAALVRGRRERGGRRKRVAAKAGHAVAFTTWRSLVRTNGLPSEEAAELMAAFVEAKS
jgi:AcrR family transcriptional regulator